MPRAVRPPNLSGSPARGSEGRRFPTAAVWAGSHGKAGVPTAERYRREARWPRGPAWLARPHVRPALLAAAGGAGGPLLREVAALG